MINQESPPPPPPHPQKTLPNVRLYSWVRYVYVIAVVVIYINIEIVQESWANLFQ